MVTPLLALRHSNLGKNHLQDIKCLREGGWQVEADGTSYRLQHPSYGTAPSELQLQLRAYPSSDMDVLRQIFLQMQYLPAAQLLLQHSPMCQDPLIVDGGANIGLFSIFFSRLFPQLRVIAVEPAPENMAVLKNNLMLSQSAQVSAFEGALWGRPASLSLNYNHGDRREWGVSAFESGASGGVSGVTLVELVTRYYPGSKIDLLKLDIEGGEFSVLTDPATEAFIAANVRVLYVELHPGFGDGTALKERYGRQFVLSESGEGLLGYNRNAV